jgi:hypothetical protein
LVKGTMQKNRGRRTGVCTLWRNLSKERTKNRRSPESRYGLQYSLKMSTTILNSLAESRTHFFGGEGLFYATFRPLELFTYNLTFSRLADRIIASAPKAGGSSRGEGSVLGVRKFTRWR